MTKVPNLESQSSTKTRPFSQNDPSLLPRDAYIRNCDVIVDPSTDIEIILDREDDHVDGLREALDVRLKHHVLLPFRLLEVEEICVLRLVGYTYIVYVEFF